MKAGHIGPALRRGGGRGVGGCCGVRAEQSPAPTKRYDTVCHLTGVGDNCDLGAARRAPVTAREVRAAAGTSALGVVVAPYGGVRVFGEWVGIAPSSVTAWGRDTSCPRCGIRFPGPLGHKNQAAALLCPRFFRHTPRALAPQAARTSRCVAGAGGASGTAPQGEGGRTYKKRSRPGPGPFYGIVSCHGGAPYRALGAVQRSYSTCMTVATVWRP